VTLTMPLTEGKERRNKNNVIIQASIFVVPDDHLSNDKSHHSTWSGASPLP